MNSGGGLILVAPLTKYILNMYAPEVCIKSMRIELCLKQTEQKITFLCM